ncbi:PAS domain S-box-containing protein [Bradyrhizobium sp. IAR9]|uniref:PAS domain S-box protein n=1 Tax=Bradyrhizobium sp. IAR9 TaxID=2663841 RepID=UPI001853DC9D|nr:PAS domain S-box protein [Bradyrhizobium sp. IAR9]NYG45585.1 PAS domain S-box-containing protein [Bradyrhizobium sp. IAR9]
MIDIAEFASAMIVINEKGITRSFSAPAVRLFGWSPDNVVGMNVSRLMPQLYRAEHERYIERYVANGERPIIGMGRIVVGERSDGSTSVGEAIARAERLFTGFIRNVTKSGRRNDGCKICHPNSCTCRGRPPLVRWHRLLPMRMTRPLSAITSNMREQRLCWHPTNRTQLHW